jgi:hypothetical protein
VEFKLWFLYKRIRKIFKNKIGKSNGNRRTTNK